MDFNGKHAINYISELSFPRRTGSTGNIKAQEIIVNHLKAFGYSVTIDEFNYRPTYARDSFLIKFAITGSFILMFCFFLIGYYFKPIINNLCIVLSLLFALIQSTLLIFNFGLRYERYIDKNLNQEVLKDKNLTQSTGNNIIIQKTPDQAYDKHIIIGAHYDSISVNYHYMIYSLIYMISTIGALCFGLFYFIITILLLFGIILIDLVVIFALIGGALISVSLLAWTATRLSNNSNGSLDNASGVSILLEISKLLRDYKLNYKLTIIFFGVEEEGLVGSINFVKKNLDELKKNNVYMISLDTIGSKGQLTYGSGHGFPVKKYSSELNDRIVDAAKQSNIKIKPQWFPYPSSDHAPFISRGINATQLFSATLIANTKQDNINRVDTRKIEDAGNILIKLLMDFNT